MPTSASDHTPPSRDHASFLRNQAHHCMRLARACPDRETSHALEAMATELMEKAAEFEAMLSIPPNADTE